MQGLRIVAHRKPAWDRLAALTRQHRLTGAEVDEFVQLYRESSADLAQLQRLGAEAATLDWLTQTLGRARAKLANPAPSWRTEFAAFFLERFPLVLYRARYWWLAVSVGFLLVAGALAAWVAANPAVQQALLTDAETRELVNVQFEEYYSANPATSFAAQVWTNNVWAAAAALILGMVFVLPAIWILWLNAANVGVIAGIMAANDRLDLFFGLITPHGLLELTAVFAAAAAGMRVGWALLAPGPRPRSQAAAQEGRAAALVALGLVVVLAISGVIEAFVTPSGLPTWTRITIGFVAWAAFLIYAIGLGRRAERNGVDPDDSQSDIAGYPPYSG
ncbi:MAG: stage II sporulation protein M [Actinomycetia bacterium]|nr:stage II sporulation protein M [Actinomycetes bacterium]